MRTLLRIFKIIGLTALIGLTIAFIYLAVGFTYFRVFEPLLQRLEPPRPPWGVEYQLPKIPQLEAGIQTGSIQFQTGEDIIVVPYIVNMGERAITVFSRGHLFSFRIYDAENKLVAIRPVFRSVHIGTHVLEPGKPYDDGWREMYQLLSNFEERWRDKYAFTLDQPGK
ncbi:hypothetical protein LR013_05665, partial [candidate division NPL-UPA2 bacterium]|nr:hypothetical protein [candidate division NPL-UPA2 bacterium]